MESSGDEQENKQFGFLPLVCYDFNLKYRTKIKMEKIEIENVIYMLKLFQIKYKFVKSYAHS